MASRSRRHLAAKQPTARARDPWTYVKVISPAFDPNRVPLRRLFSWMAINLNSIRRILPRAKLSNSRRVWGAQNVYICCSLTPTSQRWLNGCQVWWKLCVRTNSISAGPTTKYLEWIPQGHTGLPEWPSTNTFIQSTRTAKSIVHFLHGQKSITHVHRGIERCSILCKRCNGLGQLCGTRSNRFCIYHLPPAFRGAKMTL